MTETKLPTLGKNKHFCNCCQGEVYAVLLAHEAFAQEMFDKSYPEIVVRKDKVFDKLGEEFDKMYADYWRGRRDAIQSLRGTK